MKKVIDADKFCPSHKPVDLGYVEWHDWAEKSESQSKNQKQCPDCKKWFFPNEY